MSLLEQNIILQFLFVFLLTVLLIEAWKFIAWHIGLVDKPDARKRHSGSIPLVGGIVSYSVVFMAALLFGSGTTALYCYLAAAGMLVITGVLDDKFDISARFRLFIELIAALLMIFGARVYVDNLGNLFGFGDITLPFFVAVPFTILGVAGFINATNMSDGIDGMAASLGVMKVLMLQVLVGEQVAVLPSLALESALLGFLIYNLQMVRGLKKIFLGDAGSMFLGFTLVWFVIEFTQADGEVGVLMRPVTALFILGLPLVDMVSTLVRRIKKGQNPMKPDRTHVHHILMHAGFTPRHTLFIIIVMGALFQAIGLAMHFGHVSDSVQFLVYLAVCGMYYESVIHAFRLSHMIQLFRGRREPARKDEFAS